MGGIHKWNTCLCMSLGWATHHLAYICCAIQGGHTGIQQWSKCLHLHVWGGGISRKWECYTDTLYILGNINLFLKLTGTFHSIKGSSQGRSYSFISMYRMNPSVASFSSSASFSSAATCYWINCHGNHTISDRWLLASRCFLSEGTEWKVS